MHIKLAHLAAVTLVACTTYPVHLPNELSFDNEELEAYLFSTQETTNDSVDLQCVFERKVGAHAFERVRNGKQDAEDYIAQTLGQYLERIEYDWHNVLTLQRIARDARRSKLETSVEYAERVRANCYEDRVGRKTMVLTLPIRQQNHTFP